MYLGKYRPRKQISCHSFSYSYTTLLRVILTYLTVLIQICRVSAWVVSQYTMDRNEHAHCSCYIPRVKRLTAGLKYVTKHRFLILSQTIILVSASPTFEEATYDTTSIT